VERVSGAPILITGSHRSGTTWVGHALAAGGELGYIDEPFSVLHRPGICAAHFEAWFPYVTADPAQQVRPHVERMLRFDYATSAELRALRRPRDAARMARDARRFARYRRARLRPLVKDPIAVLSAPWLAREFGMRVIVTIRHPAAFASSLKRMGWTHPFGDFLRQPALMAGPLAGYRAEVERFATTPQDVVDQAALIWVMLHDVIDGYRSRHDDWMYVRHEDLSLDPAGGFAALCQGVGLRYAGGVQGFVTQTTDSSNPAEAADGRAHDLNRDSAANIWNWKQRLTADEIARVRARAAPVADRFYGEDEW
jgi:sulfotransferase family protein